jgi:copper chaperone CopZ
VLLHMKTTLTVHGMHCKACVALVTEALEDTGAKNVTITLDEKAQRARIQLETNRTKEELTRAIEAEGDYTVE